MSPQLAAALDVARELAWYPVCNATGRSSWYRQRQEAHAELQRRLALVGRLSVNASPQLHATVVAMRRVAAASFSNRCGPPYYERREAMLQLRGCFDALRMAA